MPFFNFVLIIFFSFSFSFDLCSQCLAELVRTQQPIKPVKIIRSGRQNCQTEVGRHRTLRMLQILQCKIIERTVKRPSLFFLLTLLFLAFELLFEKLFDIFTGDCPTVFAERSFPSNRSVCEESSRKILHRFLSEFLRVL